MSSLIVSSDPSPGLEEKQAETVLVSMSRLFLLVIALSTLCHGWAPRSTRSRRAVIEQTVMVSVGSFLGTAPAVAGQPKELSGVSTQAPLPDGETNPFVTLPNGVKIKDFRVGTGSESVKSGDSVSILCSGRLLNLNGIIFYNTKNNNPDGFGAIPLTFRLGKGEALPGLESGLIGMKKNGIRRIIVPPELAYSKFPDLEPKPMNANDQRALDSVVKNPRRDATILFDVQVERFKSS